MLFQIRLMDAQKQYSARSSNSFKLSEHSPARLAWQAQVRSLETFEPPLEVGRNSQLGGILNTRDPKCFASCQIVSRVFRRYVRAQVVALKDWME